MVSPLNYELAQEIYHSICFHNEEPGGRQIQIIGRPGCGKTTVLLGTVPKLFYYDRATGELERETIIWRARTPIDYWNYFLAKDFEWENPQYIRPVHVFRHQDDICSFMEEGGGVPDIKVHEYRNVQHLISLLVRGAINVVYEPPTYKFSQDFIKMVRARGMRRFNELDDPVDGSKLWYELFYYLIQDGRKEFVTIVMDEADEVFHSNPLGVDWHLHTFVMNSVRDFRKAGITLILTYHTYGDIDWMITTKLGIIGWMKGRPAPGWSQVRQYCERGFHNLALGEVIWESDGFGNQKFPRIKYRKRVMKIERDKPKYPVGRPRLTGAAREQDEIRTAEPLAQGSSPAPSAGRPVG